MLLQKNTMFKNKKNSKLKKNLLFLSPLDSKFSRGLRIIYIFMWVRFFSFRSLDSDCEAVPNRPSGNDNEEDENIGNSSNVSASDMRINEAQPGSSSSYSSNTSQRGNVSGKIPHFNYIM